MSTVDKIKGIEEEMARTQKNKATNAHLGLLKAKLAKLKHELIEGPKKGGSSLGGTGFEVSKMGDARVGLVGFPSVGKSTLLTKLTTAQSEVASYEFTTLTCIPGVVHYKGSRIQLLDLPGIIEGAKDGKGRGRQVIATARTCSLIIIVLDAMKPLTHKKIIEKEIEGFGIRLNKKPADIVYKKKPKGGITFSATCPLTHLDEATVRGVCNEYKISNGDFNFRCDATVDEFIDIIEGNRIYTPCVYAMNKIDAITIEELDILDRTPHYVPISAHHEWNLDGLLAKVWEYLNMIRIYTKPKGQIPDYSDPVIMPAHLNSIENFCMRIHKHLLQNFKCALVWGTSAKFQPQRVGKDHLLEDEDVVQIVKKI